MFLWSQHFSCVLFRTALKIMVLFNAKVLLHFVCIFQNCKYIENLRKDTTI